MTADFLGLAMDLPPTLGAEVTDNRTRFRLYSDRAERCQVRFLNDDGSPAALLHDMRRTGDGHWEVSLPGALDGALYDFLLDGQPFTDPYARYLPRGVHGPAMVVEAKYHWRNGAGISRPMREQIIYEIHIGTFTPEGTYRAATERLQALVNLGVTTIEVMPLSSFPGRRGWGYDGVAHFAPYNEYGTPDDLRHFVDEAHGKGLSVFLDVVYNHFGPAGNYLRAFSPHYFSSDANNAWGDGPNCGHPSMRNYVLTNVRYWLTEFRFDGLRLDATHAIVDPSPRHILSEVAEIAHTLTPRKLVVAEDERNDPDVVLGAGIDAVWADDFHHVAHVTVTGERDGYYGNYCAGAECLAETIRKGWLYDGQVYPTSGERRGKPATGIPAEAFIYCLQNHDQVGNRAFGDRLSAIGNPGGYSTMSMVLLFLPMTPMLFMGQEWASSSPFQYFTDHDEELGRLISSGRRREFRNFRPFADPAARERIPDPQSEATFLRSKLDWNERDRGAHADILKLYTDLIRLRRTDPVLGLPSRERITAEARRDLLLLRRTAGGQERVLLANLSDQPIPAAQIAPELANRSLLLASDPAVDIGKPLPGWTALIAAGTVI